MWQSFVVLCAVAGGFGIKALWDWSQRFSHNRLLHHKKELIRGMILDKEIDIQTLWVLLNAAQANRQSCIDEINSNLEKISEMKQAEKIDMEAIKKLIARNTELGHTGKKHGKEPVYSGDVIRYDKEIEHHMTTISNTVGEREYLKKKAVAVELLVDKGAEMKFDKMIGEKKIELWAKGIFKQEVSATAVTKR